MAAMTQQQLRAAAVQAVAAAAGKEMFILDESDRGVDFSEINPGFWQAVVQIETYIESGDMPR